MPLTKRYLLIALGLEFYTPILLILYIHLSSSLMVHSAESNNDISDVAYTALWLSATVISSYKDLCTHDSALWVFTQRELRATVVAGGLDSPYQWSQVYHLSCWFHINCWLQQCHVQEWWQQKRGREWLQVQA